MLATLFVQPDGAVILFILTTWYVCMRLENIDKKTLRAGRYNNLSGKESLR